MVTKKTEKMVGNAMKDAQHRAEKAMELARQKMTKAGNDIRKTIRSNPEKAVLMAAALGAAAAAIVTFGAMRAKKK